MVKRMLSSRIARLTPTVGTCRLWLSTVEALDLPTRHSLKQLPRICQDPIELQEETEKLLQTPVGELYASQATAQGGIDEAYHLAHSHIARAEYLQLGHASQIDGTLYAGDATNPSSLSPNDVIQLSMKPLIARMQQEGEIYMKIREQKKIPHPEEYIESFTPGSARVEDSSPDEEGYLPSSEDDSSSSSSDDDDDDESDDELVERATASASGKVVKERSLEFAPPGPTAKMQEALLDSMACARMGAPGDYYDLALQIMNADKLDNGSNNYTQPTLVTYNAALRGIATCDLTMEMVRDEALESAFSLYNHLTHSRHLPRNAMTYVYMFQIIDKAFPASRVKGNISCTLWDHATRLGVVNEQVIASLSQVHSTSNGPEFQMLLDHISGPLPQKYRRFVNKYRHSDNY